MSDFQHLTVMLQSAVDQVLHRPDGVYVDGTFGRGGHSRLLLQQLAPEGRLFAFDLDPEAIAVGRQLQQEDPRFHIFHSSFAQLESCLASQGVTAIDGLLLDLGVSSPQIDDAERGFSFMRDGPLDMRMNTTAGISASEWVNTIDEQEMVRVFFAYGEERHSRRITRAILARRVQLPFTRTLELANCIAQAAPNSKAQGKHPATRCFQAIRIEINQELKAVEDVLQQTLRLLNKEGRLVVISFHSLEDRIVKTFMRKNSQGPELPRGLPIQGELPKGPLELMTKALKATDAELSDNVRARSAIMRVARRRA